MANEIAPTQGQALPSTTADGAKESPGKESFSFPGNRSGMTGLKKHKRLLLLGASSLMLLGFISLLIWSAEPPYRPVFTGIGEQEAASVADALQKENIPYRVEAGGVILVPADRVYSVRLKLAGKGIIPEKGIGFELFDKSTPFGVSDFTQQVNYQRALQGELARTIEVLPQVAAARVHLVLPKNSAFISRKRDASASVMLQLTGGGHLPPHAITAIQNLVAASVPDLKRQAVTIVDSSGNLLSGDKKQSVMRSGQAEQAYKAKVEQRLESRLTGMLEQLVGRGQAVVRVTAKINREYVEQSNQRYNPDESVIRKERILEESRQSTEPVAGGTPGIRANSPGEKSGQQMGTRGPENEARRQERTRSYEISSTTEKRIIPFGSIERLSVAVVVGGSFKKENGKSIFVPRGQKELDAIRNLVENAIGYDEDRGDTLEVQSLPIVDIRDDTDAAALKAAEQRAFYISLARYGLAGLCLLLFAWFVLRPVARHISTSKRQTEEDAAGKVQAGIATGTTADGMVLPDIAPQHLEWQHAAKELVAEDPNLAARILYQWTSQE